MYVLDVLNPVAKMIGEVESQPLAQRPESLEGKTVGLKWSGTAGGDVVLRRVQEVLEKEQLELDGMFIPVAQLFTKRLWPHGTLKTLRELDIRSCGAKRCLKILDTNRKEILHPHMPCPKNDKKIRQFGFFKPSISMRIGRSAQTQIDVGGN